MVIRILAVCVVLSPLLAPVLTPSVVEADVYVRVHKDGKKEFTNRPSGPGWIFYMTESGDQIVIRFEKSQGKPKSLEEVITEIATKFSIEASLVKAIISVESNCNPRAKSRKGRPFSRDRTAGPGDPR